MWWCGSRGHRPAARAGRAGTQAGRDAGSRRAPGDQGLTGMDLVVSTSAVVPASVVVPLGGAALMAGFSWLLPRWARDLIAIAVALATTILTLILMASSAGRPMIYWFSGWRPSGGMVIGIDYAIGPLGAGMASLAGLAGQRRSGLLLAVLRQRPRPPPHPGPDLPGRQRRLLPDRRPVQSVRRVRTGSRDRLRAHRLQRRAPRAAAGAINFAVTNSLGGMAVLMGVGFLYARTGSLNMAQIGQALTGLDTPTGGSWWRSRC